MTILGAVTRVGSKARGKRSERSNFFPQCESRLLVGRFEEGIIEIHSRPLAGWLAHSLSRSLARLNIASLV